MVGFCSLLEDETLPSQRKRMKQFAFQEQPAASSARGMILLKVSQPTYQFGGGKSISVTATE